MPVGERGQLAVKGPQVMQGYLNRDEDNKNIFHNGFILTGDIAIMDEDGYFYIVDRKKIWLLPAAIIYSPGRSKSPLRP